MKHVLLTQKNGNKVLLHEDNLGEGYLVQDGHTLCVLECKDRDGQHIRVGVTETPEEIHAMLLALGA